MRPKSEVRLASAIVVVMSAVASRLLFAPADLVQSLSIISGEQQNYLGWMMLIHGSAIMAALVLNCRPLRQWGLVIGGISWGALGCVLLSAWAPLLTVGLVILVGFSCVYLLMVDVRKKPRHERMAPSE